MFFLCQFNERVFHCCTRSQNLKFDHSIEIVWSTDQFFKWNHFDSIDQTTGQVYKVAIKKLTIKMATEMLRSI
jgi:hypothetical protein